MRCIDLLLKMARMWTSMTSDYLVEQVPTNEVLVLRMSVLRDGTPSQDPRYAEDDTEGSVHLGIRESGVLIACSTWLPRP